MKIFPAVDLKDGNVVRLLKGDYDKMTVYGEDPVAVAKDFEAKGAEYLHVVDLDGAREGSMANFQAVSEIAAQTGLKVEVGGGIRDEARIRNYLDAGVYRVILGTVAVTDPDFTACMVRKYGERIAVGVDLFGDSAAVKGWTELSGVTADMLFQRLTEAGVSCIICTDISKDGAMSGTNRALYRRLSELYDVNLVASGGIASAEEIRELTEMGLYGAIIGKALYTGDIDLAEALRLAEGEDR